MQNQSISTLSIFVFCIVLFCSVLAGTQASSGGMTFITYTVHVYVIHDLDHYTCTYVHVSSLPPGWCEDFSDMQARSHGLPCAYHSISGCHHMDKQRSNFIFHSDFQFWLFLGEKCLDNSYIFVFRTVPTYYSVCTCSPQHGIHGWYWRNQLRYQD